MRPRVSFVVTCYNYGRFVSRAVDSLLGQTFQALEVIVVDDASTDESGTVLARYAREPRVRLIRHAQNQGNAYLCYREGMALARGEFAGVLDADDFALHPDAVSRQVALLEAHPEVGYVYCASAPVDDGGRPLPHRPRWPADYVRDGLDEFTDLVFGCYVQHSGTLARWRCHVEVGGYDPSLPWAGDWDLWLRLTTRFGVGYIAEPLYAYRVHLSNMTRAGVSPRQVNHENVLAIRKAFASLPPNAPHALRRLRKSAIRRALLGEYANARQWGLLRRGWMGMLDAVQQAPGIVAAPEFHGTLARLVLLSVLGLRRYDRLAAGRRTALAVLRGTGASAPAGVLREVR